MIPPVIHFIWIDKDDPNKNIIPDKYQNNIKTWKMNSPKLTIKYWFYNDIINLIKENYSEEMLTFFLNIKKIITKCDFARFLIMFKEGGIYADLDFYCEKDIYPIISNMDNVIFREPEEMHESQNETIFNGFFAFKPQHPFVKGWILDMMKNIKEKDIVTNDDVFKTTGPTALARYYDNLKIKDKIKLLDHCMILPYDYDRNKSKACVGKPLYIYTLWNEGSDWQGFKKDKNVNDSNLFIPSNKNGHINFDTSLFKRDYIYKDKINNKEDKDNKGNKFDPNYTNGGNIKDILIENFTFTTSESVNFVTYLKYIVIIVLLSFVVYYGYLFLRKSNISNKTKNTINKMLK